MKDDTTVHRLAVPQLPLVRGLRGRHGGPHHCGRVEHSAGDGLLDTR